jgi:drug/metabolite transporter (DMT)-like permease
LLLSSIVLVLASAVLHALWNALLKRARNLEAVSVGIQAVSLLLTAACALRLGVAAFPDRRALAWGLAAGLCEGGYFLFLVAALARAPLGWSYTWMRGAAVVLVWPCSVLLLGEAIGLRSGLGVAAVALGLLLMGLEAGPAHARGGFSRALAAGACIAGFTLCYKFGMLRGGHPMALYAVAMVVSLPIQAAVWLRRRGRREGRALAAEALLAASALAASALAASALAVAAGTLCTASFLLYLQALSLEGAGAVATLRNTSVVFALLLSWALGEHPPARHWLGALLVAAGAAALALGGR